MSDYERTRKVFDKLDKEFEEREVCMIENRRRELEKNGICPIDKSRFPKKRRDHPSTIEDGTATFFWIVSMIISILFKGGWILCLLETILWWKFITRYTK